MAKNTGNGHRVGSVRDRTQVFNPKAGVHVKRDTNSGKFIAAKPTPYKGVANEPDLRRKG